MSQRDDEQCLKLGREVVRMIRDLGSVAGRETGYTRREFTFPGGSVHMLLVNDPALADAMDATAAQRYSIQEATPPSQTN